MDEAKRKAIEKAVVELKGNWPSTDYEQDKTLYKFIHGNYVAGLACGVNPKPICTRDEFEQVKAEMQNKPSWGDAPEWAEWLAQDEDGEWYWFDLKPSLGVVVWKPDDFSEVRPFACGKVVGDWRNTLEKRTKPNLDELSAKEPTPELRELMRGDWHERGELPSVGEVVEYHEVGEKWVKCTVLAVDEEALWLKSPTGRLVTSLGYVRPLRTERDELIDYAINKINKCSDEVAETARVATISQLGMLGMLKYED